MRTVTVPIRIDGDLEELRRFAGRVREVQRNRRRARLRGRIALRQVRAEQIRIEIGCSHVDALRRAVALERHMAEGEYQLALVAAGTRAVLPAWSRPG